MKMIKRIALFAALGILSLNLSAQGKTDIVDVAAGSSAHTTLVAAVKAAGLVETLKGKGPFTVFAPTNDAFGKLPAGTVETLLLPENKSKLSGILTYHVVAGSLDAKAVLAAIKKGNGTATLTTVQGGTLKASLENGKVVLTDDKGGKSTVVTTDLKATNGVIHVIDTVLMPK
ncbi:MAG: fasciclin domain-containing protein [Chitinophagaceae bacterium]|nr:MAG: fasciclin domain-containing protein [Chitinophagaceae bacterium]